MSNERLLEYDPLSGIKTYFSSSGPDLMDWTFRYEFDSVQKDLDLNLAHRNDTDLWKKGVKKGQIKYAHIPDPILLKWHIMGVNINDQQALFEMVNRREWSYLKCTDKVHVAKG